jgi:hypothetical protein
MLAQEVAGALDLKDDAHMKPLAEFSAAAIRGFAR